MISEPGNPSVIEEWGLFLRPKTIKAQIYMVEYDDLRERLGSLEL